MKTGADHTVVWIMLNDLYLVSGERTSLIL